MLRNDLMIYTLKDTWLAFKWLNRRARHESDTARYWLLASYRLDFHLVQPNAISCRRQKTSARRVLTRHRTHTDNNALQSATRCSLISELYTLSLTWD